METPPGLKYHTKSMQNDTEMLRMSAGASSQTYSKALMTQPLHQLSKIVETHDRTGILLKKLMYFTFLVFTIIINYLRLEHLYIGIIIDIGHSRNNPYSILYNSRHYSTFDQRALNNPKTQEFLRLRDDR